MQEPSTVKSLLLWLIFFFYKIEGFRNSKWHPGNHVNKVLYKYMRRPTLIDI